MSLPVHPMIVHFPIALLIASAALDVLGLFLKKQWLRQAALATLTMAAMGGTAAVITGLVAHDALIKMPDDLHKLIETHETFAFVTLGSGATALAVRFYAIYKKAVEGAIGHVSLALLIFAVIMVSVTGYLGGEIVFAHGAGTAFYEKLYADSPEHGPGHVHDHAPPKPQSEP